ncbi:MAG: hypothetical protein LBG09_02965 [Puniceicoccales bacterium]|jgi:hypothetical protein|nr:hypothetical protein [Puniceicoccales bacterium]
MVGLNPSQFNLPINGTGSNINVGGVQKTPSGTIGGLKISNATHKGENVEKKMDASANVTAHSLAETPGTTETAATDAKSGISKTETPKKFNFSQIKPATGNKMPSMGSASNINSKGLDERNN